MYGVVCNRTTFFRYLRSQYQLNTLIRRNYFFLYVYSLAAQKADTHTHSTIRFVMMLEEESKLKQAKGFKDFAEAFDPK